MNNYTKPARQRLLRRIIEAQGIGDQEHLVKALEAKGVTATQATVSRDLQEMGFVKVRLPSGVYAYQSLADPNSTSDPDIQMMFQNFVHEIRSVNNLIVVKTSPGNAGGVASLIDGLKKEEILGTVAGDDTILVVVDPVKRCKALEEEFKGYLNG